MLSFACWIEGSGVEGSGQFSVLRVEGVPS